MTSRSFPKSQSLQVKTSEVAALKSMLATQGRMPFETILELDQNKNDDSKGL